MDYMSLIALKSYQFLSEAIFIKLNPYFKIIWAIKFILAY